MDAPSSDPNIQKLLNAEKNAQEIVSAARKKRNDRMKQAKNEAEREIAAYRSEREEAYNKKVAEGSSTTDSTFTALQMETERTIRGIHSSLPAKKEEVVMMLTNFATKVDK